MSAEPGQAHSTQRGGFVAELNAICARLPARRITPMTPVWNSADRFKTVSRPPDHDAARHHPRLLRTSCSGRIGLRSALRPSTVDAEGADQTGFEPVAHGDRSLTAGAIASLAVKASAGWNRGPGSHRREVRAILDDEPKVARKSLPLTGAESALGVSPTSTALNSGLPRHLDGATSVVACQIDIDRSSSGNAGGRGLEHPKRTSG